MSYVDQATKAKTLARNILRTQMAIRIQGRVAEAEAAFKDAIKALANFFVLRDEADKKAAEDKAKRTEKRDAFTQALGKIDGLSAEELALVSDAVSKRQAESDAKDAEADAEGAKAHAAHQKALQETIASARDELARVSANLAKLESGELKVDKDELLALANQLIADGKVEAGEEEDAPSAA